MHAANVIDANRTARRSPSLDALLHRTQHSPQAALLADSLEVLRLQACIIGSLDRKARFNIRPNLELGWLYLVGSSCCVDLDEGRSCLQAAAGDLIIAFPGHMHRLWNAPDTPEVLIEASLGQFRCTGTDIIFEGGEPPALSCGCFQLDGFERTRLRASLPSLVHVQGNGRRPLPYVEYLFRLAFQEAVSAEPCSYLIINRLVRLLLIKALQEHTSPLDAGAGSWLRAIADPEIGRTLAMMHEQPQAPWTVALLAERVAMSRSAFSARFTALVGRPPLAYLFEWRMQKAAYLLRTARDELKEVAIKVGYESASAFSKAFARWAGTAPGLYRQGMKLKTGLSGSLILHP